MNSTVKSRHWAGLLCAAGLLIAVIVARQHSRVDRLFVDQELSQLRAEHASLARVAATLSQANAAISDGGHDDSASWSWPVGWSAQVGSPKVSGSESWRLRTEASPSWTHIIQCITQLANRSGLRLNAIDIRSRGTLTQREIASIEIDLVYPTQTPPRASVADGAVFPGTVVPAKPTAVGSGPHPTSDRPNQ